MQCGRGLAAILAFSGCGEVASNAPDAHGGLQCPASYNVVLTGMSGMSGTSRYRLVIAANNAWGHSDSCAQDQPGATHLVVLETAAELAGVQTLVDSSATALAAGIWVGGVQLRTATAPGDGWIGFDDQPLIGGSWYDGPGTNGQPDSEPNDGDGMENGLEQFVVIRPSNSQATKNGLQDSQAGNSKGALCECDGNPMGAAAAAEVSFYSEQ